ncbi:MAG TPA: zinc-ribbon domain-containing protein, partial [Polyangiaceae bacterium]|nr:zinc-ribbon domain-containing protein [Polyangiaceae bacterium]
MNVQCLSCSSRYSVPDAKVQGRKVRIKCKRCSEPILIDGTHLGRALVQSNRPLVAESIPAPVPTAPPPAATRQTMIGLPNALGPRTPEGTAGAAPRAVQASAPKAFQRTLLGGLGVAARAQSQARQPAPPPPAHPPAPWTVAVTEEDQRELTTDQVVALYAVGTIDEGTYVWREGMDDWCSPFEAPDLRRALQAARISPREPLDSDDEDEDEDEAFDQSDEPIVPSSPLADDADDPRHPGMWHEPGRLGGGYDSAFEDVTVSMNEKETEGLLRKARRADFEDETTVARGSARPHSPFAEASARGPSPTRQPRARTFEFDDEEVTQAISTSEARAPFDRHDNASQRAFELSQRKHGAQASANSAMLRGSSQPPAGTKRS